MIQTLPDYLDHNLRIVSIGLNPSLVSVEAGFYFANPRNRFWQALNKSRLVNGELKPGEEAVRYLFMKYQIGFTDLVKKPSSMGKHLRAADYREGAPELKKKLLHYQPEIAWFHGKDTYRNYLKYAEGINKPVTLGAQKLTIGRTRIFVTPNPSPANAQYSLDDLIRYYNEMVSYRIREAFGLGTR